MKKCILIPDSFKGTMSSAQICAVMEKAIRRHYPDAEIIALPVADGGEGSVDAFLAACGGERIALTVKGPYFEEMQGFYGILGNRNVDASAVGADGAVGKTAVIEMAACAGLPLVGEKLNPAKTTTFGVGQLIADAARRGCSKIIVGLGGSATNDFGAGCAAGAGAEFFDSAGNRFVPTGETLSKIAKIDLGGIPAEVKAAEIIAMCDIDNPLYGKNGAAHIFGPQKGATPAMVEFLDGGLRAAAEIAKRELGADVADLPGAGAAGGMGGGMAAFFGARLQSGIEAVLDTVGFDRILPGADIVFTGEGRIDSQSLRGKVVIGVARRVKKLCGEWDEEKGDELGLGARQEGCCVRQIDRGKCAPIIKKIPVVAVVGERAEGIEAAYGEGLSAVFSILREAKPFREIKDQSLANLDGAMDNIVRLLCACGR